MALFRRSDPVVPPSVPTAGPPTPGAKKTRPTPTRKEAEAARRQRVTQTLTKKESRAMASQQNRSERMKALNQREATPEKALMRDYVDARFSLGEILLPSLVVVLALSFLSSIWPAVTSVSVVLMYAMILAVLFDGFLLWRGFKKVLAERLPRSSTRGLLMYGMNRAIQIRRFRMPRPRIKRGEVY